MQTGLQALNLLWPLRPALGSAWARTRAGLGGVTLPRGWQTPGVEGEEVFICVHEWCIFLEGAKKISKELSSSPGATAAPLQLSIFPRGWSGQKVPLVFPTPRRRPGVAFQTRALRPRSRRGLPAPELRGCRCSPAHPQGSGASEPETCLGGGGRPSGRASFFWAKEQKKLRWTVFKFLTIWGWKACKPRQTCGNSPFKKQYRVARKLTKKWLYSRRMGPPKKATRWPGGNPKSRTPRLSSPATPRRRSGQVGFRHREGYNLLLNFLIF